MTDALTVIAPRTLDEATKFASTLAAANSLPVALKKSPADIVAIVLAGAELGIPPMASIRSIHLIDGKPVLSADAMAGLCLRNRDVCEYLTLIVSTDAKATYRAKRKGAPEPVELSFTIEQAKAAGLQGKGNWAKYPASMLRARAVSAIARAVFPDLVGNLYDVDEIEPVEKHVDSTATEAPAMVEVLKASLKAKRRATIVDAPEAKPSPPALETPEDGRVGWGKNAAMKLADLEREKVEWYLADAEKKAEANAADDRDVWVDRMLRYSEELARRGNVAAGEAVAP